MAPKAAKKDAALDIATVAVSAALGRDKLLEAQAARAKILSAAQRQMQIIQARTQIVPFTKVTMPDYGRPDDPLATKYQNKKHHDLIAAGLEEVEEGRILRLIIVAPPRHGKSELVSKRFPAHILGRWPDLEVIMATYGEEFARDYGTMVREIMRSKEYKQVFPDAKLATGSQAVDHFKTTSGGGAVFAGMGGPINGRGADFLIGDDLIKDKETAESKGARDKAWDWFWNVFMSRRKNDACRVVLVMTRWHEDDIIGRLTDPANPLYNPDEAKLWRVIELPAVAREDDPLGRKPGEVLWPERFGVEFFEQIKAINLRAYQSLYQGRPTPDDGDFFKKSMLVEYEPGDLPEIDTMRIYAASDHAVSMKQSGDKTCLTLVGVDPDDNVWVLADTIWRRMPTDQTVESMIDLMERFRPLMWFAEDDHINKSIGPFLYKRMDERRVYTVIEPVRPSKDKETRAQAIRGRMAMRKVRFPKFAPWWDDAKLELLKFPNARHDDFVDPLAHLGSKLRFMVHGVNRSAPTEREPEPGTFAWIKWAAKWKKKRDAEMSSGGW